MNLDDLKPHHVWLKLLAAGLLLLVVGLPLVRAGLDMVTQRADDLVVEQRRLQESAARFDDDMNLAEQNNGRMTADDIDHLLAPVDRLRVTKSMERSAASARLSHFTYTISPQRKTKIDVLNVDDVVESDVTMNADAPLDTDVYAFLNRVQDVVPGRLHLKHFVLTRTVGDAGLTRANVHMDAELSWLSNGAAR